MENPIKNITYICFSLKFSKEKKKKKKPLVHTMLNKKS